MSDIAGDICREHGFSQATFFNWKAEYGGMSSNQLKRCGSKKTVGPLKQWNYQDQRISKNRKKKMTEESQTFLQSVYR